jgi:hypothetical protein
LRGGDETSGEVLYNEIIEGVKTRSMPLIFRSMTRDGERPKIGQTARSLGARIPGDLPEQDGHVAPSTGGMSVSRSWRDIPAWRIPIRFVHLQPNAAGKHADVSLWRLGNGPFVEGDVTDKLRLRPDSSKHALVEPSELMLSEDYQAALAATRDMWHCIDEELDDE